MLDEYALRSSMNSRQYFALPGVKRIVNSGKFGGGYDGMMELYDLVHKIDSAYRTLPENDKLVDELLYHAGGSFTQAPFALYRNMGLSRTP